MDYDRILQAMSYAFAFRATDENGNRSDADKRFDIYLEDALQFIGKMYVNVTLQ
jgi:hypothetical protein